MLKAQRGSFEMRWRLLSTCSRRCTRTQKLPAYSLAAFYARRGRMQEASNLLDWMSEKHIERWGLRSKPTIDHVLRVVDLLNSWLRPQDALAFLEKAENYLWQPDPRASGQGIQPLK